MRLTFLQAVYQGLEHEGSTRSPGDDTQAFGHIGSTREQSMHASGSNDPVRPSEFEDELMYPAETRLDTQGVRMF